MRQTIILFSFFLYFNTAPAQHLCDEFKVPETCNQIILVTTPTWSSPSGQLMRYEKTEYGWSAVGDPVKVVVGRNGLGWGRGLHPDTLVGLKKKEGDGKAPAGIFQLGSAFGYAPTAPNGMKSEYKQATDCDYFVDDVQSSDYNQWMSLSPGSNRPTDKWKSFERMKRNDHLYKLGMVVNHNMDPVLKGQGSAIFLHIWRKEDSPTAGCTAMSEENLQILLQWIDPDADPLLIQVPDNELAQLKK